MHGKRDCKEEMVKIKDDGLSSTLSPHFLTSKSSGLELSNGFSHRLISGTLFILISDLTQVYWRFANEAKCNRYSLGNFNGSMWLNLHWTRRLESSSKVNLAIYSSFKSIFTTKYRVIDKDYRHTRCCQNSNALSMIKLHRIHHILNFYVQFLVNNTQYISKRAIK